VDAKALVQNIIIIINKLKAQQHPLKVDANEEPLASMYKVDTDDEPLANALVQK
jgi:hypothetical protein